VVQEHFHLPLLQLLALPVIWEAILELVLVLVCQLVQLALITTQDHQLATSVLPGPIQGVEQLRVLLVQLDIILQLELHLVVAVQEEVLLLQLVPLFVWLVIHQLHINTVDLLNQGQPILCNSIKVTRLSQRMESICC